MGPSLFRAQSSPDSRSASTSRVTHQDSSNRQNFRATRSTRTRQDQVTSENESGDPSRADGHDSGSGTGSSRGGGTGGGGNSQSRATPQIVGYYNSFHTHSKPAPSHPLLPSYDATLRTQRLCPRIEEGGEELPPYSCTVSMQGPLAMKQELSSPFTVAYDRRWRDVHATLSGTQLLVHRLKLSSSLFGKTLETPQAGKLIKAYTLQHAEVGVAIDFRKTGPIPRSTLARMVPTASRTKLFKTDPHLFDPPREHVLRLRAEGEQFLLCCPTIEELLNWVEALCLAVDISMPLDERSEPRYRTLPRRSRRAARGAATLGFDRRGNPEAGRRLLEEQERIFRTLYPHLAAVESAGSDAEPRSSSPSAEAVDRDLLVARDNQADPEAEDLEHPDVFLGLPSRTNSRPGSSQTDGVRRSPSSTANREPSTWNTNSTGVEGRNAHSCNPSGKPSSICSPIDPLRLRRRFAPNLCITSPRASDVVLIDGKRWKVHPETQTLHPWESKPPRYGDHGFRKAEAPALTISPDTTSPSSSSFASYGTAATSAVAATGSTVGSAAPQNGSTLTVAVPIPIRVGPIIRLQAVRSETSSNGEDELIISDAPPISVLSELVPVTAPSPLPPTRPSTAGADAIAPAVISEEKVLESTNVAFALLRKKPVPGRSGNRRNSLGLIGLYSAR